MSSSLHFDPAVIQFFKSNLEHISAPPNSSSRPSIAGTENLLGTVILFKALQFHQNNEVGPL